MTVYLVEKRRIDNINEFYVTASYERTQKELESVSDGIGIIVTPYEVEDFDIEKIQKIKLPLDT